MTYTYTYTHTHTHYFAGEPYDDAVKAGKALEDDFLKRGPHMTPETREAARLRLELLRRAIKLCGERVPE
ncbi:MAG: hypothetical protein JWM85_1120 [Acidimicrobiaceae bacterium]|nr:hypothetical protein [Acidimicrobiaceae bacterium]